MSYQQVLNGCAAVAAFVAAGLWLWASRAKVVADYTEDWPKKEDGTPIPYLTFMGGRGPIERNAKGELIDVTATLARQGELNSYAAIAAGVAAALQGFALLLPSQGS